MDEETLDQFVERIKKEINEFAANWRKESVAKPDLWPLQMRPADWDDQLASHLTL